MAGVIGLIGMCAVLICALLPPTATTANLEPIAKRALANPASATLKVNDYTDWDIYRVGDYAVQDRMVIFPKESAGLSPFDAHYIGLDKEIAVVVYAPDGRDLTIRPDPPERGWYYIGEWYLYDCTAVPYHNLWWDCTLLIGTNI